MTDKGLICEEIAMEQRMLFECRRGPVIFTKLHDDDDSRLHLFEKIYGGMVIDNGQPPGPTQYQRSGATLLQWGRHTWTLQGEEAYLFCKDILPYLAKYDELRHYWCKRCIDRHENRTH